MKCLKLNSGGRMPIVGYGTWQALDDVLEAALNEALKNGYRHIDTAVTYKNEQVVGKVINEWISSGKVTRDELFIVTKLPSFSNRASDVDRVVQKSLKNLQLDYIDLFLIHTPFALIAEDESNYASMKIDPSSDNLATWKELEKQVDCGRIKAIGLSNFNIKQIQNILNNCRIKPDNLQIEHHLYLQQPELVNFCKDNEIVVTAYSCLGSKNYQDEMAINSAKELPEMLENEEVLSISKKHDKTPSQVLLRYIIQRDIVVIPKSTNPERLTLNIKLFDFELDAEDMETLKGQDAGEPGRIFRFNSFSDISENPEYPFVKIDC